MKTNTTTTTPTPATSNATSRRSRFSLLRRGIVSSCIAVGSFAGVAAVAPAAHADIVVGGVRFQDSSVACGNGAMRVWLGDNTYNQATNPIRYAQVVVYDYNAGQWVYGNWHQLNSFGMQLDHEFNFGRHGYFFPEIHYYVYTSTGASEGWYRFPTFTQLGPYGDSWLSNSCYV